MYYSLEELSFALNRAIKQISKKEYKTYSRGKNDCFALLHLYDYYLRGNKSKARDLIDFEWDSTKEFTKKLYSKGYTFKDYAEYCNYKPIHSKRPMLGDVAIYQGVLINDGDFWVSTKEDNSGVTTEATVMPVELRMRLIARPVRS